MVDITLNTTEIVNATRSIVNASSGMDNVANAALNTTKLGFLHALLDPAILAFALPILLVAAILIFVIRNVMPVSHFLYSNARIQARTNYTVKDGLMSELAEAKSLKEFKNMLRETIFSEELEKSKDDLRSIHSSLERGYICSILELVGISPEKSKPLLDAYLMFSEAKILKIIYKAKFMGKKIGEDLVYSIGALNHNLLRHLLDAETSADLKVVMAPTPYSKMFEKEYKTLEEFEVEMDEFVLQNFVGTVEKTKMYDGRYIIDILNKKADILNILALLKFRIRGIEKDKQKALLIRNNTGLHLRFDRLIGAESLKDFVSIFNGTPYHDPLKRALEQYEKDSSLSNFETSLYRFYKKFITDNDLSHTLGPYPLFSYLIKREMELRNLFIISRGIDAQFNVEKIREMVV